MRVLPYGAAALLLEPDDPGAVLGVAESVAGLPGVLEVVPAARTVLVRTTPAQVSDLRARVAAIVPGTAAAAAVPPAVVLDVTYDGADLADVATAAGLDPDGLVRAHTDARYVVAFCGFAPGFAYLTGLDRRLHLPRLAEPRTRVPAGSVGIAGEFTGVYPRASPGGWRLLGHTDATLWDLAADPPAALVPGTQVRFRAVP